MTEQESLSDKPLSWLNSNRAVTTAYCRYVLLKSNGRNPEATRTAEIEVKFFNDLADRYAPGSPEGIYLSDVRSHIVSFSEALLRHRDQLISAKELVDQLFDNDERFLSASMRQKAATAILLTSSDSGHLPCSASRLHSR